MKAKEKFAKWMNQTGMPCDFRYGQAIGGNFPNLPQVMKNAVHKEFFRCHDIWIEITSETPVNHIIKFLGRDIMSPFFEYQQAEEFEGTIEDAETKSIEIAFLILDGQLRE